MSSTNEHKKAGLGPAFKSVAEGLSGLEIPLELNARRTISTGRHKGATEFGSHNHLAYIFLIEEVAGKSGDFPSFTAHTYTEVSDAIGVDLGF